MNWNQINRVTAAAIFVFTTIIYTMTVAPTVSFWDCGEFIATSFKMAVPHPPGAPLYLLVGRIFSMLPFHEDIAFRVNMISVLSSSITIMLLYLVIVHLVREWKGKLETNEDWMLAVFSGILGSLTYAFTRSFWFNSSEAEVYAPSMLFTALLVWLSLKWAEKSNETNNEKYLLMISYLIGLAIAVHLLNVLALPFVAMIYYYKRYTFTPRTFGIMVVITVAIMFTIYPGIVKHLPHVAEINFFALFLVFALFAGVAWWAVANHRHLLSFVFLSITLIMIGYSSYGTIYIRSGLDPNIDENNPENVENFMKYINREQYGEHDFMDRRGVWQSSPNGNQYSSTWDFFWSYQVNHMYIRYFMWQFVGFDEDTGSWHNFNFYGIPFLLGLIGMIFHFRRDPKHALSVLALFFATGLAIILYLNQPDPQPRERDYSYVGSFFAFSIWIGLGFAGTIDLIRDFLKDRTKAVATPVMAGVLAVLLVISPANMMAKNYEIHDRSGNFVAWDYSYNMLQSCEPDAILFTNGDNDTFPLWYLQEVEGIRTDVRIVNLSLLNTDWYIEQLRDMEPKVPMRVSDAMLGQIRPVPWQEQEVSLKVPQSVADSALRQYKENFSSVNIMNLPTEITFKVPPTIRFQQYNLLRTQDYMILNILTANRWTKPVYFATTVPQSNLVGELANYMRMEGLVLKLVPFKNWDVGPDMLQLNLLERYRYRNLDNPDVYFNPSIVGLLQNYRTGFIQLAEYYARFERNKDKLATVLDSLDAKMPAKVIPWTNSVLRNYYNAFQIAVDTSYIDTVLANPGNQRHIASIGRYLLGMNDFDRAAQLFEKAAVNIPENPDLLGGMITAYEMSGQTEKAISALERWLKMNPADSEANRMLQMLKRRMNQEE